MDITYHSLKALSIGLFLFYGLTCLFSGAMVAEFERFGLARFRRLTGGLEVLGALGLAAGWLLPRLDLYAGSGLAALMVLGITTRIRVRDPVVEMVPAIALLLVNLVIVSIAAGAAR